MQTTIPILPLTVIASAIVTACRFITSAGALATATDTIYGVSRSDAAVGEAFTADILGVATLETGGAVAFGDRVKADATGRAIAVTPGTTKTAVISGGTAGALTVTGLAASDELVSVIRFDVASDSGTSATGNKVQDVIDLTSEFSVSAANTIDNTGGTNTTGDKLMVIYRQKRPIGGIALAASSASGQYIQVLLIPQASH